MKQWIDSHVHIKDEPGLALTDLIEAMKCIRTESGLSAHTIAAIPSWDEEHTLQNLLSVYYKACYNEDTYYFGGLDYYQYPNRPEGCDFEGQLRTMLEMGADGAKLIETKPMVRKRLDGLMFTDPAYDGYFSLLAQKRIPMLWHVGDPETFWHRDQVSDYIVEAGWFYGDGSYPEKEALYNETCAVLDKYPGLQIVFAHMFFLSADRERADRFLDAYPDVRFDVTPGGEMYGNFAQKRDEWRDFFIRRQDRIIYGTDSGWSTGEGMRVKIDSSVQSIANVRRFFETDDEFSMCGYDVKGLRLPEEALEKILSKNYLSFIGGKPQPVNRKAAAAYGQQVIKQLSDPACGLACKAALIDRAREITALLAQNL